MSDLYLGLFVGGGVLAAIAATFFYGHRAGYDQAKGQQAARVLAKQLEVQKVDTSAKKVEQVELIEHAVETHELLATRIVTPSDAAQLLAEAGVVLEVRKP